MPAFNYKYPRPAPGKSQEGPFFKKEGEVGNGFFPMSQGYSGQISRAGKGSSTLQKKCEGCEKKEEEGKGGKIPQIQLKKIGHKQLTWPDFTGKPNPKSSHSAWTHSEVGELKLKGYPFKSLTEVANGTTATIEGKPVDCAKGKENDKKAAAHPEKYQAFKLNIEPDLTKLAVNAFFWEGKSWVKPLFVDKKTMEAEAEKKIKKCKAHFEAQIKSFEARCKKLAKTDCARLASDCEKSFKEGNTGWSFDGVKVGSAKECRTKFQPACVEKVKKDCIDGSVFGEYTEKNKRETEAIATNLDDCSSKTFKKDLLALLEDNGANLLNHEQRHFDISNEVSKKLNSKLTAVVAAFKIKEIEACSKGAAIKKAKPILLNHRQAIDKEIKSAKAEKSSLEKTYDSETGHGTNVDGQDWWGENIDDGIKEKSGKGKF